MKFMLPLMFLFAAVVPTLGAETPWQEVAPGVKLRLVSNGQADAAGHTWIGLEIDMPANTKTYWRVPGETGIPTQIDTSGSTGIGTHSVHWPYPTRDTSGGYTDFVYWGATLLPIELDTTATDPTLAMAVTLGVCSEVCIPAQASFELPLDFATPDRANGLRIRQALALTPLEWTEPDQPIGGVTFDPSANALAVHLADPRVDPQSVIATSDSGDPLFGAPQKSPEADLVMLPVLGKIDENSLENQSVQLTFMTDMGSFMLSRRVGAVN